MPCEQWSCYGFTSANDADATVQNAQSKGMLALRYPDKHEVRVAHQIQEEMLSYSSVPLYGDRRLAEDAPPNGSRRELLHVDHSKDFFVHNSGANEFVCVCDIMPPPPPPDLPAPPIQPGCQKYSIHTVAHIEVLGAGYACQYDVPNITECEEYKDTDWYNIDWGGVVSASGQGFGAVHAGCFMRPGVGSSAGKNVLYFNYDTNPALTASIDEPNRMVCYRGFDCDKYASGGCRIMIQEPDPNDVNYLGGKLVASDVDVSQHGNPLSNVCHPPVLSLPQDWANLFVDFNDPSNMGIAESVAGNQNPNGPGCMPMYYLVGGQDYASAVLTNAQCMDACRQWKQCATFEFTAWNGADGYECGSGSTGHDGGAPGGCPTPTSAGHYMCKLWVYPRPCEVMKYTAEIVRPYVDGVDGLTRNPDLGRVVCGAGLGYLHKDHGVWTDSSLRTPQTFDALEEKVNIASNWMQWTVATSDGIHRDGHYRACGDATCVAEWANDTCPTRASLAGVVFIEFWNGFEATGGPIVGDGPFDFMGSAVATSWQATEVLVGAHENVWSHAYNGDADIGFGGAAQADNGYVKMYRQDGSTDEWIFVQNVLNAPTHDGSTAPENWDNWGTALQTSENGRTIAVGATQHVASTPAAIGDGYIVVYKRGGDETADWVKHCELPSYRTQPHADGISIDHYGEFLAVGESADTNYKGRVTVYDLRTSACEQWGDQIFAPSSPSGGSDADARWGWSVALRQGLPDNAIALILAISAIAEDGYRGWVRTYMYDPLGGGRRLADNESNDGDNARAGRGRSMLHGFYTTDPYSNGCVDTDNGAVNSAWNGCDWFSLPHRAGPDCFNYHEYYEDNTAAITYPDSGLFTAMCMCCACGGGTTTTFPECGYGGGVSNGVWNIIGTDHSLLTGSNQGDMFGYRVALGQHGLYLTVTAPGCYKHTGDGSNANSQLDMPTCTTPTTSKGYVRVFRRLNRDDITENWVQIGADADIEGEHAGDYFGLSLSMAYDYESPVMVGAPFWKEQGGTDVRVGRAYVYAYDPFMSKRYKHFKTFEGDTTRDKFGWSVSISEDATRAVIGAQTADPNGELDGFRGTVQGYRVIFTTRVVSSSFEISGPSRRRLDGSISTFNPAPLTASLAAALAVNVSAITLSVEAENSSIHVTSAIDVPLRDSNALLSRVDALFANVSAASAVLGVAVEVYQGTTIGYHCAAAGVTTYTAIAAGPAAPAAAVAALALAPALGASPAAPAAPAGVAAAGSAPPAHAAALATTPATPAAPTPAAAQPADAAVRRGRLRRHVLAL